MKIKRQNTQVRTCIVILSLLIATLFCGCQNTANRHEVINLTIWHVYGEQSSSPMDSLIDEFNATEGKAKGINITTTNITSVSRQVQELSDAMHHKAGALAVPDLVTCSAHDIKDVGIEAFMDWREQLNEDDLSGLNQGFVANGETNGKLLVLPVIQSASVLFLNQTDANPFFYAAGIQKEDLMSWDGFFNAAEKYYAYSGGKAFCSIDFMTSFIDLYAMDYGGKNLYLEDSWYDPENTVVQNAWNRFARAVDKGWIKIPKTFASQDVMTSAALCSMGSSAGILYNNDTVTDESGKSYTMQMVVCPVPGGSDHKYYSQGGVGLCAVSSTREKESAMAVFARWLLKPENNLRLAVETGYMPAVNDALDQIDSYHFENASYASLYQSLKVMQEEYKAISIPLEPAYFTNSSRTYEWMREHVGEMDPEEFGQKVWEYVLSCRNKEN